MKTGRKPVLTFSEQVKLRSIQAAFGKDSPEEEQFWEQASTSAKLRRAVKRGKHVAPKPRSTIYHGLQSRGNLMAVCPGCKEYLERKDKEDK